MPPSVYAYAVITIVILILVIRYKETIKAAVMGKVAEKALENNDKINDNNLRLENTYEKDKQKLGVRPSDNPTGRKL